MVKATRSNTYTIKKGETREVIAEKKDTTPKKRAQKKHISGYAKGKPEQKFKLEPKTPNAFRFGESAKEFVFDTPSNLSILSKKTRPVYRPGVSQERQRFDERLEGVMANYTKNPLSIEVHSKSLDADVNVNAEVLSIVPIDEILLSHVNDYQRVQVVLRVKTDSTATITGFFKKGEQRKVPVGRDITIQMGLNEYNKLVPIKGDLPRID